MTMTWQEGLTFFVLIVVGSFIAAGIRAWLEGRRRKGGVTDGRRTKAK